MMGLEDFEREIAQGKARRSEDTHEDRHHRHHRHDDTTRDHRRRHHHRSHTSRAADHGDEDAHRRKRHRRDDEYRVDHEHRKRHKSSPSSKVGLNEKERKVLDAEEDNDDEWVEKETSKTPTKEKTASELISGSVNTSISRDAWMHDPMATGVEYVQSRKQKPESGQFIRARESDAPEARKEDASKHLADLERDLDSPPDGSSAAAAHTSSAEHEVHYKFGDNGSSWRMAKLKGVYRQAEESGRDVDEVALDRYGSLQDFDDAREEERELERRRAYGSGYAGLETPSGELFKERGVTDQSSEVENSGSPENRLQGPTSLTQPIAPHAQTIAPDRTALNKLKAQWMKAKLRNAPNASQLEEEYKAAENAFSTSRPQTEVVVLDRDRMLAGDRSGEVSAISGKRGRERGLVEEKEDMSVEDMVKQERRTKDLFGGEGRAFAERIAKDSKFVNDLDYMDENAQKLSKSVVQSESNLRNVAIGDFQKMNRILNTCPLCYHEDSNQPPTAPVVSLATRTYMTLPTEPEVAKGGAVIVPIQHHLNLLECDDDEWEEIRNFMKSLARYYFAQDKGVIFYENAAFMHSRRGHAALFAVPLPQHLAESAPAYFKEAVLASDEQWSQHKPIIDTLALAKQPGYGKAAFRKAMVKEMPYFHVFYTLDGGMGHVIEDDRKWPKGDLFVREIIGGMLNRGPEVIKKQGRWEKHDRRVEGFRKRWHPFDWTTCLLDAQQSA